MSALMYGNNAKQLEILLEEHFFSVLQESMEFRGWMSSGWQNVQG